MGARREVLAAVAERYRTAGRGQKGRILDELTATTGWHRKHAVRALSGCIARPAEGKPSSATEAANAEQSHTAASSATQVRRPPRRADRAVGGLRSGVRQAAQGDDPGAAASA